MKGKKATVALVVLMMAATSICFVPADQSDATDGNALQSIVDAKVGESVGIRLAGELDLDDILEDAGELLHWVAALTANMCEITEDDFYGAFNVIIRDRSALDLMDAIHKNPKGVDMSKADLMNLFNRVYNVFYLNYDNETEIKDFDIGIRYNMTGMVTRFSEHGYVIDTTALINMELSFDGYRKTIGLPHDLMLENGKLEIRNVSRTVVDFVDVDSSIEVESLLGIEFSGYSTLIDDEADTFEDMFGAMYHPKGFRLPLVIEARAGASVASDSKNITLRADAEVEAYSKNKAMQDLADRITSKVETEGTFGWKEFYRDGFRNTVYYEEGHSDSETGRIITYPGMYVIRHGAGLPWIDVSVDLDYLYMEMNVNDIEMVQSDGQTVYKDVAVVINPDEFRIDAVGYAVDLTGLMGYIKSNDVRYGEDYVLTAQEIERYRAEYEGNKGWIGSGPQTDEIDVEESVADPVMMAIVIVSLLVVAVFYVRDERI